MNKVMYGAEPVQQKNAKMQTMADSETQTDDPSADKSLKQRFLTWTLHDLCDYNPTYVRTCRGVLNIIHMVLSIFVVFMIGAACTQQLTDDESSVGFYCKTHDTFTFVVACTALIYSALFFACCVLTKKSDVLLLGTSYELVYYVVFALLFCIGGVGLTTTVVVRNNDREEKEEKYHVTFGAGIFALMNTIVYAISAIWFLMYHKTRRDIDENADVTS